MTLQANHLPVEHLRLPTHRHIPGTASVAELTWLKTVADEIPSQIVATEWQENLPYRYGWFLFLNQYFWEAHEVWEPVWLKAAVNSKERFLIQGLIQLANAGLKHIQGNTRAENRLREIASEHFDHVFSSSEKQDDSEPVMGVSPRLLISLIQ